MNIILNVSGQTFEVNKNVLMKIPYFHDMFDMCDNTCDITCGVIFVNRPSHIFKHVLALTIDPLYPYPAKYAFELDFYGICYDKNQLYDKHQELINKINIISNENTIMNCELERIKNGEYGLCGPCGPRGRTGIPGPMGPPGKCECSK